jgi:hypothetical protein
MATLERRQSSLWGRLSCVVWFSIAAWFINKFAIEAVALEDQIASWEHRQGIITEAEVDYSGPIGAYALDLEFTVDFGDETRTYRKRKGTDDEPSQLRRQARKFYQPGTTLGVRVNPADRSEFALPLRRAGLLWIGYLGGGFFGLIGLSVLFGRVRQKDPATARGTT